MSRIIRVQKGGIVPIRIPFREIRNDNLNGQLINVNGGVIQFLNPDGTNNGSPQSLQWEQLGILILYWDTSSLTVGDYKARVRYGYAFSSAQNGVTKIGEKDVILRLVNVV